MQRTQITQGLLKAIKAQNDWIKTSVISENVNGLNSPKILKGIQIGSQS